MIRTWRGSSEDEVCTEIISPITRRPVRMSHRKWREGKQQPSRARSGNQLSCCLVSLHFLCDIPSGRPVHCRSALMFSSNVNKGKSNRNRELRLGEKILKCSKIGRVRLVVKILPDSPVEFLKSSVPPSRVGTVSSSPSSGRRPSQTKDRCGPPSFSSAQTPAYPHNMQHTMSSVLTLSIDDEV